MKNPPSAIGCVNVCTLTQMLFYFLPTLQHHSFYDFIINKARGKSGPLFNFDVHEDIRMINDATVEKDEVRLV